MNKNKKNTRLRVAIILAALLLVVIVMGIRNDRDRLCVPPEVPLEERVLEVQPAPPELEEIPEVRIEDIPFEQIPEEAIVGEEPGVAEEEDPELDIFPTPEELERIKEEGAVLF